MSGHSSVMLGSRGRRAGRTVVTTPHARWYTGASVASSYYCPLIRRCNNRISIFSNNWTQSQYSSKYDTRPDAWLLCWNKRNYSCSYAANSRNLNNENNFPKYFLYQLCLCPHPPSSREHVTCDMTRDDQLCKSSEPVLGPTTAQYNSTVQCSDLDQPGEDRGYINLTWIFTSECCWVVVAGAGSVTP